MIFEKVRDVIAAQLNVKPEAVKPETDIIKDLKADSLDIVEMLFTLESEFNITVPEDKATSFKVVKDFVDYIDGLKK